MVRVKDLMRLIKSKLRFWQEKSSNENWMRISYPLGYKGFQMGRPFGDSQSCENRAKNQYVIIAVKKIVSIKIQVIE